MLKDILRVEFSTGLELRTERAPARPLSEIRAANITSGRVLRQVNKAGWVWGTGMTQKLVWHVVRNLGCKQRIRAAGNDRIGIEPAG